MTEEEKPYSIVYEDRDQYLYAQVAGLKDSAQVSIAYWREVAAELRVRRFRRLLVTESFANTVSVAELYEVASQLHEIMAGFSVAFVDRATNQYEDNRFAETVSVNRGTSIRLFWDEADAIEWLVSLPSERN